ncbi:MAG: hypothetical protein OMM_03008 [Candidatus Magnetoglobus multicellularis str. Araruama]|uniref:Uncharacterized protein n=2 Tax=Candidatus Magnetoglobus multicellularis TaxID=418099 RepID=A0A1V1P783_9BACT|nr:putative magnetosome protein [Candidatus Magnetoglobus multicellularis]AFX88999.1 putative magnetosome protein [Candidatus Magnetoglobus multicellularis]ETR70752.1 MAG: hypothetical protein OMM_03008 [Candidatus Magnetoglobus multicellularis str. Araruama]
MAKDKNAQDLASRLSSFKQKKEGDMQPSDHSSKQSEKQDGAKMSILKDMTSSNKELKAATAAGPVGLDIGTSHIVMAQSSGEKVKISSQLNAFFTVPNSKVTYKTLQVNQVKFFEHDNNLYIFGFSAQDFANMFNANLRRPIESGIVSAREEEGIMVIQSLLGDLIPKPSSLGMPLCFGVPGEPVDGKGSVIYHEAILSRYLRFLGYNPTPINEGLATVMSELKDDGFTGIGISMGGGMCNVCMAYMSVPVFSFSIQKGGDYVDQMAAESVGESITKMNQIKEEELDFTQKLTTRVSMALNIFYEDLISTLLESLHNAVRSTERLPRIKQKIPIVLSGGTVMPRGFVDKFKVQLKKYPMPFDIADVRRANEPLITTAQGALFVANNEAEE